MTMMLWHLQIRNLNLMFGKLKDYFINHICFSSRLTGLTLMMLFQKTSRVSVPAFYPQILISKLICFQNFANVQKYLFRAARRFSWVFSNLQIIFMYLSTVLFETENIIKLLLLFLGGRGYEFYITLSYQICSSYLRDYMANCICNIKVFANVIKS